MDWYYRKIHRMTVINFAIHIQYLKYIFSATNRITNTMEYGKYILLAGHL